MNILIALNENKSLESKLSNHFGHCTHFSKYNLDTKKLEILENIIDHKNTTKSPVDQMINFYHPDMIFTLGIGKKAIDLFKYKKIILKTGKYNTLKEVINNINNLEDITNSCEH